MYLACICAVGDATRKPNKIHITRKALVGPDRFCYDRLTTSRRPLLRPVPWQIRAGDAVGRALPWHAHECAGVKSCLTRCRPNRFEHFRPVKKKLSQLEKSGRFLEKIGTVVYSTSGGGSGWMVGSW